MNTSKYAVIILGATGDLANRKLIPALARMCARHWLCDSTVILGSGRTPLSTEAFRNRFNLPDAFRNRLHYHAGFEGLRAYAESLATVDRYVVFFALPPSAYAENARLLRQAGFGADTAVIIEKPFGRNLETARALNRELSAVYPEQAVYRIDHYLAKEAVRNLLTFRFANTLFEPVWNNRYVEAVHISALETLGVEGRGAYFDTAGTLRDMVQNHLLQMLSLLLMEPPASLLPAQVVARKIELLKSLTIDDAVCGQYEGYRSEKDVSPASVTETYVELKLQSESPRWKGVPVFIRAGKALNKSGAEITVLFKPASSRLFPDTPPAGNRIILAIQPAEGFFVELATRIPGRDSGLATTSLNFCLRDAFAPDWPDPYETLLLDALHGDRSLFVTAGETEEAWRVVEPFLDKNTPFTYARGTLPGSRFTGGYADIKESCHERTAV